MFGNKQVISLLESLRQFSRVGLKLFDTDDLHKFILLKSSIFDIMILFIHVHKRTVCLSRSGY